jgi:hypothetical protein
MLTVIMTDFQRNGGYTKWVKTKKPPETVALKLSSEEITVLYMFL